MSQTSSTSQHLLAHFLRRDPQIESRIAAGIETHRKGDGRLRFVDDTGSPVSNVRVSVRQMRHDFLFGANIFQLGGFATGQKNQSYEQAFLELFNTAVVPFYWSDLEPEQGKLRFDADSPPIHRRPPPDFVLDFCDRHQLVPKGHCLTWHQWLPTWLSNSPSETDAVMRERIRLIGARYGHRISIWDVVNEPMEKYLFPKVKVFADDYAEASLEETAKAFPEDTSLFVNEATTFSWREFQDDTTGFHLFLENLRLKGCKIDGIGLQYHLFFYNENGLTTTVADLVKNRDLYLDPARLLAVLDLYGKHGLPVHISEITLPTYPDLADAEQFQADLLRELYRLWFSHPSVEAIYWWNLNDGNANAEEGKLRGGLLDTHLNKKPSYETLNRLVHEEWTTAFQLNTDAECSFRGFYGDYEVVTEYAGQRIVHQVGLHRGAGNEFCLSVSPAPEWAASHESPNTHTTHVSLK
ncbi:MAG: endo-1,4-beta-xylanase [Opitutaceae bacterium]|jgi:GH35 family endo-1,4-beta-xylanase